MAWRVKIAHKRYINPILKKEKAFIELIHILRNVTYFNNLLNSNRKSRRSQSFKSFFQYLYQRFVQNIFHDHSLLPADSLLFTWFLVRIQFSLFPQHIVFSFSPSTYFHSLVPPEFQSKYYIFFTKILKNCYKLWRLLRFML